MSCAALECEAEKQEPPVPQPGLYLRWTAGNTAVWLFHAPGPRSLMSRAHVEHDGNTVGGNTSVFHLCSNSPEEVTRSPSDRRLSDWLHFRTSLVRMTAQANGQ